MRTKVYEYDIPDELLLQIFSEEIVSISLDTETTGLIIPYNRLCVLQLFINEKIAIIVHFPEAIYDNSNNIKKILETKAIKLFHFARFDIAMIIKHFNINVSNPVCTRILSKIARPYTNKHGLKNLCKYELDVNINKTEQSSYWGVKKLTKQQIEYAIGDVIYLWRLYNKLKTIAQNEKKYHIANEAFKALKHICLLDVEYNNCLDYFFGENCAIEKKNYY